MPRIELLNSNGERITTIENSMNPEHEFQYYRVLYGASSWREIEPEPPPEPEPAPAPGPQPPSVDELALALTDAQLQIADQQQQIDDLALAVTELQIGGIE